MQEAHSNLALTLPVLAAFCALPFAGMSVDGEGDTEAMSAGFDTIEKKDVEHHLSVVASPALEGRDSPSLGLLLAAEYISSVWSAAGLLPAEDSKTIWSGRSGGDEMYSWSCPTEDGGTYLRPYSVDSFGRNSLVKPVPDACMLALQIDGEETLFEFGYDFTPLDGCDGDVRGELAFAGFGIESKSEHYNDFKGLKLSGKVVVIFEGEPGHRKRFDGEDVTSAASKWTKLKRISDAGARGALIVRRDPAELPKELERERRELAFRYTVAYFNGSRPDRKHSALLPALEISLDCATALLGQDARKLLSKMDKTARPTKIKFKDGRTVGFAGRTTDGGVQVNNLVGIVPGSDLAHEVVIVGAHYDHIGVGSRGRIGAGADDNGSGTSAMLEVAQAMALAKPRRTVLFAAFSAEEKGLIGSKKLANDLPVPIEMVVAMVNLDMIGRGKKEIAMVIGMVQNPGLKDVVERARKLKKTGIRKIQYNSGAKNGLFKRSDHYSFHQAGIPTIFFMEDLSLGVNQEYHTWKDTIEMVDITKVANTAKIAFTTAWILANDERRPTAPLR